MNPLETCNRNRDYQVLCLEITIWVVRRRRKHNINGKPLSSSITNQRGWQ